MLQILKNFKASILILLSVFFVLRMQKTHDIQILMVKIRDGCLGHFVDLIFYAFVSE